MLQNAERSIFIGLGLLFAQVFLAGTTASAAPFQTTPQQNEVVYRAGGDVKPPKVLTTPAPAAKKDKQEHHGKTKFHGTSVLQIVIKSDGSVGDVKIVRSLGTELDSKAIDQVRTWKFEPGTRKGAPVAVQVQVEVNFNLY